MVVGGGRLVDVVVVGRATVVGGTVAGGSGVTDVPVTPFEQAARARQRTTGRTSLMLGMTP